MHWIDAPHPIYIYTHIYDYLSSIKMVMYYQVRCMDFGRLSHIQTYRKKQFGFIELRSHLRCCIFCKSCCMKTVYLFRGICLFIFYYFMLYLCLTIVLSSPSFIVFWDILLPSKFLIWAMSKSQYGALPLYYNLQILLTQLNTPCCMFLFEGKNKVD